MASRARRGQGEAAGALRREGACREGGARGRGEGDQRGRARACRRPLRDRGRNRGDAAASRGRGIGIQRRRVRSGRDLREREAGPPEGRRRADRGRSRDLPRRDRGTLGGPSGPRRGEARRRGHETIEEAADAAGLPSTLSADAVDAAEPKALEARAEADRLAAERSDTLGQIAGKTDAGEGRDREGDGAEEDMTNLMRGAIGYPPRGQVPGGRI
jgi:hypothetical protein